MAQSALYVGHVLHHRLRPRVHRLRYRLFSLLLDLDDIDALSSQLRLFSRGRFNLFGFTTAIMAMVRTVRCARRQKLC